jgi:hypothetical protein
MTDTGGMVCMLDRGAIGTAAHYACDCLCFLGRVLAPIAFVKRHEGSPSTLPKCMIRLAATDRNSIILLPFLLSVCKACGRSPNASMLTSHFCTCGCAYYCGDRCRAPCPLPSTPRCSFLITLSPKAQAHTRPGSQFPPACSAARPK